MQTERIAPWPFEVVNSSDRRVFSGTKAECVAFIDGVRYADEEADGDAHSHIVSAVAAGTYTCYWCGELA